MFSHRPFLSLRQREELCYLANYAEYLKEKVEQLAMEGKALPPPLAAAISLLPQIKRRIESDKLEAAAKLWREAESQVAEWYTQEARSWRPKRGKPPSGSQQT